MVMLVILRLSMHILNVPAFLGTHKVGTAHGLKLSLKYPLCINSSTYLFSSLVSLGLELYTGLGKLAPGTRSIWAQCLSQVADQGVIH